MASVGEVNNMIGRAIAKSGFLDDHSSVAVSSGSTLFIQLNGEVFSVDVNRVSQFDDIENRDKALEEAQRFMSTHPKQFEKAKKAPSGQ